MSQHDFDPSVSYTETGEKQAANPQGLPVDPSVLSTGDENNTSSTQSMLLMDEETSDFPQTGGKETPTDEQTPEMLPPEARGEVNGGPLGCCLGTTVGLFLSLTVAIFSRLYSTQLGALFQQNYGLMGVLIRVLMVLLAIALAILCGRLGWRLGKRFYREYDPPVVKTRKSRLYRQK